MGAESGHWTFPLLKVPAGERTTPNLPANLRKPASENGGSRRRSKKNGDDLTLRHSLTFPFFTPF